MVQVKKHDKSTGLKSPEVVHTTPKRPSENTVGGWP